MWVLTQELFLGREKDFRHLSRISNISHSSQSNSSKISGKCVHLYVCAVHKEYISLVEYAL